jgi:glycine dehydrogenase
MSFLYLKKFFLQTIDVLKTRAAPLDIQLVIGDHHSLALDGNAFGALLQYPDGDGLVEDYTAFIKSAHQNGTKVVMAADLLSLTLLKSPGELGAEVAIGSSQRFGVPIGYGGPHAAYFATKESYKRQIPGRIIGVSIDAQGNKAYRMALQTREQHIKREKATSNICTAQALLANMAAMYAVYHGAEGLKEIASRIHQQAADLSRQLTSLGFQQLNDHFFDTLKIDTGEHSVSSIRTAAENASVNFRYIDNSHIGISLDETVTEKDIHDIIGIFGKVAGNTTKGKDQNHTPEFIPPALKRESSYLTHPVFNTHRSETQLMRYLKTLENRDLSLNTSMIPLGSCTMKLNAASEMIPVSFLNSLNYILSYR